jgi:hypothetical protein
MIAGFLMRQGQPLPVGNGAIQPIALRDRTRHISRSRALRRGQSWHRHHVGEMFGIAGDGQGNGLWATQDPFDDLDKIVTVFLAGANDAGDNRVGLGPGWTAVAAIGLADEHARSNFPFRFIVGWLDRLDVQKREQPRALLAQEFGEASVVGVGVVTSQQPIQGGFQATW